MGLLELTFVRQSGEHYCYHCKPNRTFTIGRGSDSDIRVLDFTMSRHHADVFFIEGAWKIANRSQTGELLVNGKPISETSLAVGDFLTLGNSLFTVGAIRPMQGPLVDEAE